MIEENDIILFLVPLGIILIVFGVILIILEQTIFGKLHQSIIVVLGIAGLWTAIEIYRTRFGWFCYSCKEFNRKNKVECKKCGGTEKI